MARGDRIPTSRVRRTARLGGLAATQAARQFGTRAANIARSEEAGVAALERRHVETAEQIVAALGSMKGAAMKLGQVLSFLDVGMVPEDYREEFQRKLAELRAAAPPVRFADMRKVIEQDLDDRLASLFSDFDPQPIASASIGQVYRATLQDGRDVAVKVQYPGVAAAVRADLQNLGLILRLLKPIAPGLDAQAIGQEVRERVYEELDYELEASNQGSLARLFRGHPFIAVPDVVPRLCRERVIVSEYVEGMGFEQLKAEPQSERDRLGEILFRFFFGCLFRFGQFSGDPHPGNFLRRADGSVAFLDFGLFKRMSPESIRLELYCQRLIVAGDAERLMEVFTEHGLLGQPERFDAQRVLQQMRDATWWYLSDGEVMLRPEIATRVALEISDPRSPYFDQLRHETLPADHLFARRLELLTLAVIGQLRAEANWHAIAREWIYGDPPVTELGRRELVFLEHSPAAARVVARA